MHTNNYCDSTLVNDKNRWLVGTITNNYCDSVLVNDEDRWLVGTIRKRETRVLIPQYKMLDTVTVLDSRLLMILSYLPLRD